MAFEDFKNERGSEINRIFKENKSILNERRKRASETTQRINAIKREIDMTKEALNLQKSLREKQGKRAEKVVGGQWDLSHPAWDGWPWILEDRVGRGATGDAGVQPSSLGHHLALVSPGEPESFFVPLPIPSLNMCLITQSCLTLCNPMDCV